MQQEERIKTYKLFKEGSKRILVATDLVGRGIDIERVNIVINYDMPETDDLHGNGADTYLHRVCMPDHVQLPAVLCTWVDVMITTIFLLLVTRWGAPGALAPRVWPSPLSPLKKTLRC